MQSSRPARRRPGRTGAMLYSMVMANGLIVGLLGLSALTVVRVERRATLRQQEMETAQLLAWSGIELAVRELTDNTGWRTDYTHNVEATPRSFGGGTVSWKLLDAGDANLADDPADAVDVQGIGRYGDAVWVHALQFPIRTISALDHPLHAHGRIDIDSGCQLTATGAAISTNGVFDLDGNHFGSAECQLRTGNGGATGPITEKAHTKTLPGSSAFAAYVARATVLPYSGNFYEDVLTAGVNTYGGGLNTNGVYYINTGGNELDIRGSRLAATLIVDGHCHIDDQALLQPHRSDYPVLIVSGNLRITTNSANQALVEDDWDTNFNPTGAAYMGSSDTDENDTYPNQIQGLIHVRGDLTLDNSPRVRGVVLCEGQAFITADDAELVHDPALRATPPVDYQLFDYVLSAHGQSAQRAPAP